MKSFWLVYFWGDVALTGDGKGNSTDRAHEGGRAACISGCAAGVRTDASDAPSRAER